MHSPKTGQAKGELTHNTDDAHRRSGSGPCARPRILPFCLRRPSLPLRRCEVSLTVLQLIFIFIFFCDFEDQGGDAARDRMSQNKGAARQAGQLVQQLKRRADNPHGKPRRGSIHVRECLEIQTQQ